ncbi:MAG TPA: carbon-nitrogen hydrolase family protein [Candidatus Thiothrix moscowensis]|uniref:carbon-nitrogen hydrolase family protein n=1 Tax=unclassified Thiothrix TaxID=2636184 RepID=UPI001A31EEB4|nr:MULTISPECIES: carbon-nitrogen hydrolase family protein [unclassified Thiothrix]MBJ6610204.1 carbon-nitrogen hydrolase family protein [Candidatus Thiothrix moscowensis]HRJ53569.1 carbon-nitrogen hydrolase family protein [Candidatus Thiothrix moscowensis]HRJ93623.1 carbon-nitrogen hydrolase family protein [Candidatus Thiothrix moscowensis]
MTLMAAIQMASGPQVQANLMEAGRLIKEAAERSAKLVVLPETFAMMGANEADRVAIAETFGEGPIQAFISQQAKKHGVWIVAGTIPIRSDDPGRAYAASILYNDKGEAVARYDKIHLFDVLLSENQEVYTESDTTVPGHEAIVVDTPFGKLGMSVCYDLRFPELYRRLSARGAQILVIPSAFTELTGNAHWEALLRARAIENLCYVIAPGQGGYHVNGRTTYGHSMIIDYWGRIRGVQERGTGVVIAEIELAAQEQTRKTFPVLSHRCPESIQS